MYHYTFVQWLFFFYFYSFFGWCFESTYVSIKSKKLVNRGFMRGPFLPIYGSGAIMMLVVSSPFQDNLFLVYLAGCVGATALEYVTGVLMEALFKVRYWDYSNQKFQFQGHICLGSTLAWGGLTILVTRFVHKPIEHFVLSIPNQILTPVTMVLTVLIGIDFALSFKAALDLKDVLVKMENAKAELLRIQKRLDVIVAVTQEDLQNRKDKISENISLKMDDLKTGSEEKLDGLKNGIKEKPSAYSEALKEELQELRYKYRRNVDERSRLSSIKDFFQRDLLRSNPTMNSSKFHEALDELKKKVNRKHKNP